MKKYNLAIHFLQQPLDIDPSLYQMHREWTMTMHAPTVLWRSTMAPLSDHCARSGGEAHTSACGREAAVMRLDSGATDSHMRRQGSSVQGERLPHRTQSVLPLSGCATAASPPPTPLSILPSYFFSGGKIIRGGQTDQWSSTGQFGVRASL